MEVKLIDKMGSDLTVVNAARVSFSKESSWDQDESFPNETFLSVSDQGLIKYLAAHNHWTPFSHVQITLREKVPIFVARQRFKHMVGFTYNEVSRRYVDDVPEFYVPTEWRKRADNKKQGSSDEVIDHWSDFNTIAPAYEPLSKTYQTFIDYAVCLYSELIEQGVAPEQARMILPQSMYTEYIVTGSLAAWARAYKLRIDEHSQKEIRDLAALWGSIIGDMEDLKHSWQALTA